MTSSPAPDLDDLERLGTKAHPRPWRFDGDRTILDVPPPDQFHVIPPTVLARTLTAKDAADAAYIVALVNAAPALLTELRAAREAAAAPTPLAPPAGISPVETAGHSSSAPDLDPRTEAGRRLLAFLTARRWLSVLGDKGRELIPAIEAEAAAESGRLREALRYLADDVEAMNGPVLAAITTMTKLRSYTEARALLATPPAPSDHGLDVERVVELSNLILDGMKVAGPGGSLELDHRAWRERAAKVLGIFPEGALATPSAPPEAGT